MRLNGVQCVRMPVSSKARKKGPPYSTDCYSVYVHKFTMCVLPRHRHVIRGHPSLKHLNGHVLQSHDKLSNEMPAFNAPHKRMHRLE